MLANDSAVKDAMASAHCQDSAAASTVLDHGPEFRTGTGQTWSFLYARQNDPEPVFVDA